MTRFCAVRAVVCVLVVTSTYCGGGGGSSAPTSPSTSSPPPPSGSFTIACGTTSLDLTWSGTETRSCTVTSSGGFDGSVALTCSGVSTASCELDPATVRVTAATPASATMKLTYTEGMAFGSFNATVRGTVTGGSGTASTTVNVLRDANSITRHCPSASEVAAIDSAVLLAFEHDPTAGRLECQASNGSRDLTYFQANVYKGLSVLRHITFAVPIPWTSGSLWQWFTGSVRGIRFQNRSDGTCCFSDLMILFPTTNAAAHPEQVIFTRLTDLSSFMTVVVHEARHANGSGFPHCEGGRDRSIDYMGGIGVSYYFNRLMAEQTPPGFTPEQERIGLLNVARIRCNTMFCEPQTCNF